MKQKTFFSHTTGSQGSSVEGGGGGGGVGFFVHMVWHKVKYICMVRRGMLPVVCEELVLKVPVCLPRAVTCLSRFTCFTFWLTNNLPGHLPISSSYEFACQEVYIPKGSFLSRRELESSWAE